MLGWCEVNIFKRLFLFNVGINFSVELLYVNDSVLWERESAKVSAYLYFVFDVEAETRIKASDVAWGYELFIGM